MTKVANVRLIPCKYIQISRFFKSSVSRERKNCTRITPSHLASGGIHIDADLDGGRVDQIHLKVIVMTNTIIFLAVMASFIGFFI